MICLLQINTVCVLIQAVLTRVLGCIKHVGAAQTAYSIIVTSESGDAMWNSGWTEGDKSVAIPYAGKELAASTEYTVQIAVKDQSGAETAYAATTFETGLMSDAPFADADWIAYNDSGKITSYSIDFDFIVKSGSQGFCFSMSDTGNFVMWQVNTVDSGAANQVWLRPHFKSGGGWTAYPGGPGNVQNVDVSAAVGCTAAELIGKTVHERIVVDGVNIKTYFGADEDSLTLAYEYNHSQVLPLNNVGFRHNSDTNATEVSCYDNLVIRNAEGNVVYSNDFSENVTLQGSSHYSVHDGMLEVGSLTAMGEYLFMLPLGKGGNLPGYRKSVDVKADLVSAKLYTSGLGVYESYINGQRVGRKLDDGSVQYDELKPGYTQGDIRRHYSAYDVTWMLDQGAENVLAAVVTAGWWSASDGLQKQGSESAYIAKLILTYADGSRDVVATDTSWKADRVSNVQEGTSIYKGERYDARLSQAWMKPGYDDSAWPQVKVSAQNAGKLQAWDGAPIAVRKDLERTPQTMQVYEGATGASTGFYGTINVVARYEDGQDITLNPGQTLIVDFGQNFVGWEVFSVTSEAGTVIHVEHGEWINDGNGATSRGNDGPEGSVYNASYRSATADTYYTTAGGEGETWHPGFSFYGFRYAEFTADKPITIHKIRGEVVSSVWHDTASMTTSDADVNQLLSNVNWSMYGNYFSVPTDCPQRDERLGWLGDTQVFSQTGLYLGENKSFLRKFLQDIRDAQRSDGAFSDIAPNAVNYGGYGGVGWADCGIILPYNIYVMTGDKSVIEESWASMVKYMDQFLGGRSYGGNATYGDWLSYESNSGEGMNMLGVCYHAWDARMMADMAKAIGDDAAAAKYQAVYQAKKAQFQSEFVSQDGTVHVGTQTACLYALFVDMVDDPQPVVDQLVANIERNGNKLQTGFMGTAIITETLTKVGRSDVAYKLLLQHDNPSWLYSVDQGATTIWERWNSYTIASGFGDVTMNSFNHYAYGDVVGWMYSGMAGIANDVENPGFKHFTLAPQPDQTLPEVDASFESPYGTIVSHMAYEGDTWNYRCTVPANTTATIRLPVEKIDTLTANGKANLTAVDGLTYVGYENGIATFEAAAGSYAFSDEITRYSYVNITIDAPADVPPVEAVIYVNGEAAANGLPAALKLKDGDVITADVTLLNGVDYAITNWTVGETVISEGAALHYTVDGSAELRMHVEWTGYESIATGKAVTAASVGNDWRAANLTDGVLSYLGGTNGWSSNSVGSATSFGEVTAVIDLGTKSEFNRFHLYPRNLPSQNEEVGVMNCPTAYTFYISDDNQNWTPVYSTTDGEVTNGFAPIVIALDETVSARYVKLGVTAVNRGDEWGYVYVQLSELGIYNVPAVSDDVALIVTGAEETSVTEGEVSYTVSAKNMNRLVTAALAFRVSEETLEKPVAEAVGEGWFIIAQSYENGVLKVVMGNNAGTTGDGDLLKITAQPTGQAGAATLTLTKAELCAYEDEGEKFVPADLTQASATTNVTLNIYDVNRDGVVDLLDITRAQRYYGTNDAICDVNKDGEVNIADLILIMNNFTEE